MLGISLNFSNLAFRQIGLDFLALLIAAPHPSPPSASLSFLDFLLESLSVPFCSYICCPLLDLSRSSLRRGILPEGFKGICMSEQSLAELSLKFDALSERFSQLSIQVENLLYRVEGLESARQEFSLVTSVRSGAAPSVGGASNSSNGDYNGLASEIPAVPDFVVRLCANLVGSKLSSRERATRAWEAGWWARFVLEEKIHKPRPTRPIELGNTTYVVLRADGHVCPLVCQKAGDYRFVVGDFKPNTLSHGFPSQSEAKAYCLGAGVEYPSKIFQWNSQQ